jgi:PBP1b-binding outer membrane lipoprotein LpoB
MISRNGMGSVFAAVAGALALALFLSACAKQENAPTAQADTQAQVAAAQADIPEVIVSASREDTVARR